MNVRTMRSLARTLLTDEKFPDPVVPPDLHLVQAVHADADGTVGCVRCQARVPLAQANMVGSDGYACAACTAAIPHAAPPVDDGALHRSPLPWLLLLAAMAVGVIALLVAG
jgi:hypothetical protein